MDIFGSLENRIGTWLAKRAIAKTGKREWFTALLGQGAAAGFAGAHVNRLTMGLAQASNAVNSDLDGQLVILRSRARQLSANNEFAKRFLTLVASNVVGACGPTLQVRATQNQRDPTKPTVLDKPANDAVETHWKRWCKTADIGGRMTFAHLLRVTSKAVARDGEALVRIVRNRTLPYGIALQVLEADRLDVALNKTLAGGAAIRQGVEIDGAGMPVAYWLRSSHPGDRMPNPDSQLERVSTRDLYHLFIPERAEQIRGYTWFHAVLMRAAQLQGFEESAVVAARIGASKIAALVPGEDAQGNPGEQMADAKDSAGNFQINAEAGDMIQLPPGYKLESWDPQYPHENFGAFVNQCLRAISMGFDVAAHNLSGNMADVNYSSARIAELAEREIWMMLQEWMIDSFVLPIYKDWLASALLLNQITFEVSGKALPADKLQKFSDAAQFRGRRWAWVDPVKEAEASEKLIALGLSSRTAIAASQGRDFEDIVDELKQERELLEAAGLPGVAGKPPEPKPAPPPPDPADTVAAAGKAMAEAIASIKPPEVKVENHISTPEREVRLEANIPSVNDDVIEQVRDAVAPIAALPDAMAAAMDRMSGLQERGNEAIAAMSVAMAEGLERVAEVAGADRVPVFNEAGDPVRSRIALN